MKLLKLAFITLISVSLLFCSCKKKPEQIPAQNLVSVEITKSNHTWYYFSSSGFDDVDRPRRSRFKIHGQKASVSLLQITKPAP